MKLLPILVSVPHGGTKVPDMLQERINLTPLEILIDSDARTREIFAFKDRVKAYVDTDISRCVVDVNRDVFTDASNVFKQHSQNKKEVWKTHSAPNELEREALLERYYRPYHQCMRDLLQENEIQLAIDAHAMIPQKKMLNSLVRQRRPLFCISNRGSKDSRFPEQNITASFALMKRLKRKLEEEFSDMLLFDIEHVVTINDPFRGGYITAYHGKRPDVPFVQIEINRALYLPPEKDIRLEQTAQEIKQIHLVREKLWRALEKTVMDVKK